MLFAHVMCHRFDENQSLQNIEGESFYYSLSSNLVDRSEKILYQIEVEILYIGYEHHFFLSYNV